MFPDWVWSTSVISLDPNLILTTNNNRRLRSARDNDLRSETLLFQRCALRTFHGIGGQNTRDHIVYMSDRRSKMP